MPAWLQENGFIATVCTSAVAIGTAFGWVAKSRVESKRVVIESEDSLSKHEELFRRTLMAMITGLEQRVNEQSEQISNQAGQLSIALERDATCQRRLSVVELELISMKKQHEKDHG